MLDVAVIAYRPSSPASKVRRFQRQAEKRSSMKPRLFLRLTAFRIPVLHETEPHWFWCLLLTYTLEYEVHSIIVRGLQFGYFSQLVSTQNPDQIVLYIVCI